MSVGNSEFLTNETISHSYAIYPYADRTHEYVSEGMLVFMSRHADLRYRLYNVAPIFKLNVLQAEAFLEFKNSQTPKAVEFRRYLQQFGDKALLDYAHALREGIPVDNGDLKKFHALAQQPEFIYLTSFGILSHWNFAGSVISKGESTGSGAYMDHHSPSDVTYVVGIATEMRCRTGNLWGSLFPGDKVYLILTRESDETPFVWYPYMCRQRDCPGYVDRTYKDKQGRTQMGHVVYVGLVTEVVERDPTRLQIDSAILIDGRNAKDGYDAYASIPSVMVQIRI